MRARPGAQPPAQLDLRVRRRGRLIPARRQRRRVRRLLRAAASALEKEAEALRLASDGGANRFVVAQYGIARGAPTTAWRDRLGDELVLFFASRDEGASAGAGAGAAVVAAHAPELLGLVMAWQPGGSRAARLHGGAVRWAARTAERVLLLERVAEGVALVHSAEPRLVVHGDIKSDNVLLASLAADAEPRLSDFSLAELRKAAATQAAASTARAAAGAYAGGTASYKAPEMYRSGRAAPALEASRSKDVFALATLAWEVLVG